MFDGAWWIMEYVTLSIPGAVSLLLLSASSNSCMTIGVSAQDPTCLAFSIEINLLCSNCSNIVCVSIGKFIVLHLFVNCVHSSFSLRADSWCLGGFDTVFVVIFIRCHIFLQLVWSLHSVAQLCHDWAFAAAHACWYSLFASLSCGRYALLDLHLFTSLLTALFEPCVFFLFPLFSFRDGFISCCYNNDKDG